MTARHESATTDATRRGDDVGDGDGIMRMLLARSGAIAADGRSLLL
jgi:hypothetical protein